MENPFEIDVQKPVSDWLSNLSINKTELFKGLGKVIIDGATANWSKVGKDFVDIAAAVKSNPNETDRAFLFLYNSVCRATVEIYADHQSIFEHLSFSEKEVLNTRFDDKLAELKFTLDMGFFNDPGKSEFLNDFSELFRDWLVEFGIDERKGDELIGKLPNYFYSALVQEWRDREDFYQPIVQFLTSSPFAKFWEERSNYSKYLLDISKPYMEPVLGDQKGMTLTDIYVEPDISSYDWKVTQKDGKTTRAKEFVKFGDCHKILNSWIQRKPIKNKPEFDKSMVIVLGYPGQGKTSMCYRLLHDYCSEHGNNGELDRLYFLKFRDIIDVSNLLSDPFSVIHQNIEDSLGHVIDRFTLQKSTIILDGMDELYMKEGLNVNDIDTLILEFNRLCDKFDKLRIVITSRYGYIDLEKINIDRSSVVSLARFNVTKQVKWLKKYNKFHQTNKLNEEILRSINKSTSKHLKGIKELINQPILLHLVASSDIDVENVKNRSEIYDQLFKTIVDRNWDKSGQIKILTGLTQSSLRKFLQELALHIYLSDFEYARKSELEEREYVKRFLDKLSSSGIKESLKGVMIAFYLNETKKSEEDQHDERYNFAVEFLHKSLQEYLVAEKIWNGFKFLISKWDGDYHIDSHNAVIDHLITLTNKRLLSTEVRSYLDEIISSDPDSNEVFERLDCFFPKLLEVKYTSSTNTKDIEYGVALFHLYWTVMKKTSPNQVKITLKGKGRPVKKHFSKMVRLFKSFHYDGLDFSNVYLEDISFVSSNFMSRESFENSTLIDCNFHRSLVMCSFNNSNLKGTTFLLSRVESCSFIHANFDEVSLRGAAILSSDFANAKNLTFDQLKMALAINKSKGLDEELLKKLKGTKRSVLNSSYYKSSDS